MSLSVASPDAYCKEGITTSLKVVAPGESVEFLELSSPLCGFGWRFLCRLFRGVEDTSSSDTESDVEALIGLRVALYFDPHLLKNARYGSLSFAIVSQGIDVIQVNKKAAISLPSDDGPDGLTTPLLAEYHMPLGTSAAIQVTVKFSSRELELPYPSRMRQGAPRQQGTMSDQIKEVLASSIRGQDVPDIKFYAYTRKSRAREVVFGLQPMFAKREWMTGKAEGLDTFLDGLCDGGGREAQLVDMRGHRPSADDSEFGEYDYMSDSDLETDDEGSERPGEPDASSVAPVDRSLSGAGSGHAVVIKGHSFDTWMSMLYFLYTNEIRFKTSEESSHSDIPECSAKSMYRLAQEFDLPALRELCQISIRSRLAPETIFADTFSSFTSRYEDIQDMHIDYLLDQASDSPSRIVDGLKDMDGVSPVLAKLVAKLLGRKTAGSQSSPCGKGKGALWFS
ncbi:unnamed protein product [Mycena citricolor]|uniref:BTB domain-containing protein n=1 Tax=Mycena citricolor TaxID=2018698 RepID=A0AAD2HRW2_9AGAR|nr:unnamed protein product [Mycena citricolor]